MASAATDAGGLGATLFAAASGTAPFDADGWAGVRAQPVRRLRRLPAATAEIIDACLDPDPAARPAIARIGAVLRPLAA